MSFPWCLRFYWVSLGCIGFYWVLPCFTGFYWVFLGFSGSDWVFVRLFRVLLGLTSFRWVLLDWTAMESISVTSAYGRAVARSKKNEVKIGPLWKCTGSECRSSKSRQSWNMWPPRPGWSEPSPPPTEAVTKPVQSQPITRPF